MPLVSEVLAVACIAWYVAIILVTTVGCLQLLLHYSHVPEPAVSASLPIREVPRVTVIRPCKGLEPYLYECLASSLHQDYPRDKLTVYFCVSSRKDAALPVLEHVKADFRQYDIQILIEEEDPSLTNNAPTSVRMGPNPKVRNMSRAYREAKSDLVWILDCNIWVGRGVCGRMVDRINGYSHEGSQTPFKFVHHLPVAVDVPATEAFEGFEMGSKGIPVDAFGGRLDEAFLSSAHAKMYVAINTVAVAPCICGKSSMFRRSHLNALTNKDQSTETRVGSGIDFFSDNICEDHLIGDLIWKTKPPTTMAPDAQRWKNHGLVYGDIALQPISAMTVSGYIARRVRWLRVRKFTVPLATLVEPGTESLLGSLLGAIGFTTFSVTKPHFGRTWTATATFWLCSLVIWLSVDWAVYNFLQSGRTVELPNDGRSLPRFAQPKNATFSSRRPFLTWFKAWAGRELLALPIWLWAIWGGASVVWRDKKLWVGFDMKVHEYDEPTAHQQRLPLLSAGTNDQASANGIGTKARLD